MTSIAPPDLFPFQVRASSDLAIMVQEYPGGRFKPRFDPETGKLSPFLCRLSAITGAGKTPILAHGAALLQDGIVLWTTPRGAVVSQTLANLQPGGKYSALLPPDTSVYALGDMSDTDWEVTLTATSGLTILVATVASFNRDGDALRIHRPYGDSTRWAKLGSVGARGPRRLYVFYDEGHGATAEQFERLRELNPKAFVLASASPLPENLADLLPGKNDEERQRSLRERTVVVPTKEVVDAGLLKRRLYFMDCDVAQADAVAEANAQWEQLTAKFVPLGKMPVACFIVNETQRGLDVWEYLVDLGVSKSRIAVHLDHAAEAMEDRHGSTLAMVDTYSGKKPQDRSPDTLRAQGYTHIIWNLTLREGWDEPYAYVAYIDDQGRSKTDIVQKIGRFLRQPDATLFDDPDLNAAYFYFKVTDEEFSNLIRETQAEMETEGYEVIRTTSRTTPQSRTVEVERPPTVPSISPWFGDSVEALDAILLESVPLFAPEFLTAEGAIQTRVLDLTTLEEDEGGRAEVQRNRNDIITPWQYLSGRLARIDSRIIGDTGTIFSSDLRVDKRMTQPMQYNSPAMRTLAATVDRIKEQLNEMLQLVDEGKYGVYTVKPFKLTSPDITGVSDTQREKYKVRQYKNAVHREYNGLNSFEAQVAAALDTLGKPWCRNPVGGYRIPIPQLGADDIWFYPDFLLWVDKAIWALDPKGKHLLEAAVQSKLLYLNTSTTPSTPIRIALLLEGHYTRDAEQRWSKAGKEGYTFIKRVGGDVKPRHFQSITAMVQALTNS